VLQTRGTITDDVEHVPGGKTFFWAGEYSDNLNERATHVTDLNVFADFEPKLSPRPRTATSSSWPTSSPSCSSRCASSAAVPASWPWTR
jgi:hypothetical protein